MVFVLKLNQSDLDLVCLIRHEGREALCIPNRREREGFERLDEPLIGSDIFLNPNHFTTSKPNLTNQAQSEAE